MVKILNQFFILLLLVLYMSMIGELEVDYFSEVFVSKIRKVNLAEILKSDRCRHYIVGPGLRTLVGATIEPHVRENKIMLPRIQRTSFPSNVPRTTQNLEIDIVELFKFYVFVGEGQCDKNSSAKGKFPFACIKMASRRRTDLLHAL